jgi:hypothetical protein
VRLGVISDTHDHLTNIRKALALFRELGVEAVVHAGDVVAPFAAKALLEFDSPLLAVFGNNDGERAGLSRLLDIEPGPRELSLDGKKVVLAHDAAEVPDELARSSDVVVTGHTHDPGVVPGRPATLNPGEAGGWLTGRATCAVLDLDTMEAEILELGGP